MTDELRDIILTPFDDRNMPKYYSIYKLLILQADMLPKMVASLLSNEDPLGTVKDSLNYNINTYIRFLKSEDKLDPETKDIIIKQLGNIGKDIEQMPARVKQEGGYRRKPKSSKRIAQRLLDDGYY